MGDRVTGSTYKLMTFASVNSDLVQVGMWTSGGSGLSFCAGQMDGCVVMRYNSANPATEDEPVAESPPAQEIVLDPGVVGLLLALAVIALLVTGGFATFVAMRSSEKIIKASQPNMLYLILVGCALGAGKVIVGAVPITTGTCIAGLWLGHLAFWFVFAVLFAKTWRIHSILNGGAFKRKRVTEKQTLAQIAVVLGGVLAYMVLLTVLGQPHRADFATEAHNQRTEQRECAFVYPQYQTVLFIIEAACLVFGARLCWATKDVPDAVNESFMIAAGERSWRGFADEHMMS